MCLQIFLLNYRLVNYRLVNYRLVNYRLVNYRLVNYRLVNYRNRAKSVNYCREFSLLCGRLFIARQRGDLGPAQRLAWINQVRIANFGIGLPQGNPKLLIP